MKLFYLGILSGEKNLTSQIIHHWESWYLEKG